MKHELFLIVIFSFLFLACSSIKFKELEIDQTQVLKGSVKELIVIKEHYDIRYEDSVRRKERIDLFYDKNNRQIKQIDYYDKKNVETIFNYNKNGTVNNKITKYEKFISRKEYIYDQNKNNIEYCNFENDSLVLKKTKKFDSNNNVVEANYYHPKNVKLNSKQIFIWDYKSRTSVNKLFDYLGKEKDNYSIYNYDKKGNIIKTQIIKKKLNSSDSNFSFSEYDNFDNLTKLTIYDGNGQKRIMNFINTYDKVGNILLREEYSDGKLFLKVSYEITYY